MTKALYLILFSSILLSALIISSCQQGCVNKILLQTTSMDLKVNTDNLGISSTTDRNNIDTIRSKSKQFYNYPEFRQFGKLILPRPTFFISSAYAASDDCPDQVNYISRMDEDKTKFSIDIQYDASALGLGVIPADSNLMSIDAIKTAYLQDLINNIFLNAGAPSPLTISENFFQPINTQWVSFIFYFEEIDGTPFRDTLNAYVDLNF